MSKSKFDNKQTQAQKAELRENRAGPGEKPAGFLNSIRIKNKFGCL
jgi:hypothetical protein